MKFSRTLTAVLITVFLSVPAVSCQTPGDQEEAQVRLFDDLGSYQRAITTDSDQAKAYFDQGLRLQYAFNHPEAIRAYEQALEFDPGCAMCWWGIALAAGPNINSIIDQAGADLAREAIAEAIARIEGTEPVEAALIRALSERYGPEPIVNRVVQDSAWATTMQSVATDYSEDPDVLTLLAASRMNLSPWNYWEGPYNDRTARP